MFELLLLDFVLGRSGGVPDKRRRTVGFVLEHGERDKGQLRQLRWIHEHINRDGNPLKGWSEKLGQRALDSLANDGCLASLTTRYDLTLQDFNPHSLESIYEEGNLYLREKHVLHQGVVPVVLCHEEVLRFVVEVWVAA